MIGSLTEQGLPSISAFISDQHNSQQDCNKLVPDRTELDFGDPCRCHGRAQFLQSLPLTEWPDRGGLVP